MVLEISMRYSVISGKVVRRNQIIQNIFIERQRKLENELQKKKRIARDLKLIKYDSQIRGRETSLLSWIINKIRKSRRKKTFSKKNLEEMK